jgi:hypothetical protein
VFDLWKLVIKVVPPEFMLMIIKLKVKDSDGGVGAVLDFDETRVGCDGFLQGLCDAHCKYLESVFVIGFDLIMQI